MDIFRDETFGAGNPPNLPAEQKTIVRQGHQKCKRPARRCALGAGDGAHSTGRRSISGRASTVFSHRSAGHRLGGPAAARRRGGRDPSPRCSATNPAHVPQRGRDPDCCPTFQGQHHSAATNDLPTDEGQAAPRVDLIKNGVLETFLMSRQPHRQRLREQRPRARRIGPHAHRAGRETSS